MSKTSHCTLWAAVIGPITLLLFKHDTFIDGPNERENKIK
jgi:hypothetical protein